MLFRFTTVDYNCLDSGKRKRQPQKKGTPKTVDTGKDKNSRTKRVRSIKDDNHNDDDDEHDLTKGTTFARHVRGHTY
jgi:hypothetical protein